jgi:alcohol dehydrogenase class IV
VEDVDAATLDLLQWGPRDGDAIIGIGGGSALDLAKAVAAMATNACGTSVLKFLEGVGSGRTIEVDPLPMIALPATAGTGSEATKNAVITGIEPPFKKSLRSPLMVPRVVIIDPELTVSQSESVTAQSGMDAITQLIESYITRKANPVTKALGLEGLRHAPAALRRTVADPENRSGREVMSQAAFLSGVALANSGLGMAHGVAAALGAVCDVPHGLACAVMLPVAMRVNRECAEARLAEIGRLWAEPTSHLPDADAADLAIQTIDQLIDELRIPRRLSQLGVTSGQIDHLVVASRGNSMNGNPREISDNELRDLLLAMI